MTNRSRVVAGLIGASLLLAACARWDDATGTLDTPWLGRGERARLFTRETECVMCPTGFSFERSWGSSGRSGQDPYLTVGRALGFLHARGVLDGWPQAIGEGSVGDGDEIITPRAAPYRFTVVMIEPTVVIMRFDLGALVKIGGADPEWTVGTPRLNQGVEFGTRLPATGSLSWFSPDANQLPTPVPLITPEHGEIVVAGLRLALDRHGDEWTVARPAPAK